MLVSLRIFNKGNDVTCTAFKNLRDSYIIRKFITASLLMVFAVAIAPKQLLHDAIATHKHSYTSPSKETKFTQSGFVCDCENLVAESVFLDFSTPIILGVRADYTTLIVPPASGYLPIFHSTFRLRGPPPSL